MGKKVWVTAACVAVGLGAVAYIFERPLMKMLLGHSAGASVMRTGGEKKVVYDFDGPVGADAVPAPWKWQVIAGKLGVKVVEDAEEGKGLEVKCEQSHFIVWNESQKFEAKDFPILTWKWKAEKLPAGGDVRTHSEFRFSSANKNDKVLQVLVGFEGDNVLSYVWDTTAPVGTEVDEWSPVATVKTRVVETGETKMHGWVPESVNIVDDYRRRFGAEPGKVLGVSVQTNSNHTASEGDGIFGQIVLRGKDGG